MAKQQDHETHIFSYRFNGREYTIDIVAKDADEAKERLRALAWAQYDGVLVARIPAGLGPLARIAAAIRNATRTMLSRHA